MARGRRAVTPKAEEPIVAVDETVNTGLEFEESDDELEAVELTAADLYEDTAPPEEVLESDVAVEKPKKVEEVAEKAIAETGRVYVTYKGLKVPGRPPKVITLIVPDDGTEPDDELAIITSGETFVLRLEVPAKATETEADWLVRHPVFLIEKS